MLVVEISQIPSEGLDIHEVLQPGEVHIERENSFVLGPGGRLECRVEKGEDETVQVRGHLQAQLRLECGRCLEAFLFPLDQDLDLFYLPRRGAPAREEQEDEVELSDHEMVVAYYAQNRLDLGEMVREQFFMALPMKRVCRDACLGICPSCGTNRNQTPCTCVPEVEDDPRLAPLRKLFDRGSS